MVISQLKKDRIICTYPVQLKGQQKIGIEASDSPVACRPSSMQVSSFKATDEHGEFVSSLVYFNNQAGALNASLTPTSAVPLSNPPAARATTGVPPRAALDRVESPGHFHPRRHCQQDQISRKAKPRDASSLR